MEAVCRFSLMCWVEGDNHCPPATLYAPVKTAQDAVSLLCCQGHCQHPQVFSSRAAAQPVSPQPVPMQVVTQSPRQDCAWALTEFHEVLVSPFLPSGWKAVLPANVLPVPSSLVSSADLLSVHSFTSSKSWIKMFNRTDFSADPGVTLHLPQVSG